MLEQRKVYGSTERCLGTGRNRSHYEEESHLDSFRRKQRDLAKFSNQNENILERQFSPQAWRHGRRRIWYPEKNKGLAAQS